MIPAKLFIVTKAPVTEQHLQQWCWELGEAFGPNRFDLQAPHLGTTDPQFYRRALSPVPGVQLPSGIWAAKADDTTTVLQCHVAASFYGPGLEAGDAPFLLTLMSWLDTKIPFGMLYYGCDLPHIGIKLCDRRMRGALMKHFLDLGHVPFRIAFARRLAQHFPAPHCGFCRTPMRQITSGPLEGFGGFVCDGCGHGARTLTGGASYEGWDPSSGTIVDQMIGDDPPPPPASDTPP